MFMRQIIQNGLPKKTAINAADLHALSAIRYFFICSMVEVCHGTDLLLVKAALETARQKSGSVAYLQKVVFPLCKVPKSIENQ